MPSSSVMEMVPSSMSMPEAGWHHDGRFNLVDLVRMTEIEQSAEWAAQPFADYAD